MDSTTTNNSRIAHHNHCSQKIGLESGMIKYQSGITHRNRLGQDIRLKSIMIADLKRGMTRSKHHSQHTGPKSRLIYRLYHNQKIAF